MDVLQNASKEIVFSGSRRIPMLEVASDMDATQILKVLNIECPKALIMISGGAANIKLNKRGQRRLSSLFSLGIARAAAALDAAFIDGGTSVGVMKMVGQGVADQGYVSTLVGVVPADQVTYPGGPAEGSIKDGGALDPNHSHFVLVRGGTWGTETETMYRLAKTLAKDIPVLTILADGGENCKREALQAVRNGWPIIVVEGSGGEADRLARLWRRKSSLLLAEAIDQEDSLTSQVVEEAAEVLGIGIASIINFLNPNRVILGGDVVDEIDLFFDRAVASAKKRTLHASLRNVSIVRGRLGSTAGAYGAAVFAKEHLLQKRDQQSAEA